MLWLIRQQHDKNGATKHTNPTAGSKDEKRQRIEETNSKKQDHKLNLAKPATVLNENSLDALVKKWSIRLNIKSGPAW